MSNAVSSSPAGKMDSEDSSRDESGDDEGWKLPTSNLFVVLLLVLLRELSLQREPLLPLLPLVEDPPLVEVELLVPPLRGSQDRLDLLLLSLRSWALLAQELLSR